MGARECADRWEQQRNGDSRTDWFSEVRCFNVFEEKVVYNCE